MEKIDLQKFYDILIVANNSLSKHKEHLNSLNVFPVPDGDTGTNMASTFSEAVKSIQIDKCSSINDISSALSRGALMGARGNSGVILSQILRGLSKGLEDATEINVEAMVKALSTACESAYKAVMKPKEGTILTVIKAASDSATLNKEEADLTIFMKSVLADTNAMLEQTREMLPENKSAGTVDAGGAGLVVILQAFLDVLEGKAESPEIAFNGKTSLDTKFEFEDIHDLDHITFQYCTEFIILNGVDENELREKLDNLGDSIVVVSMDDITKVHIHTNEPGTALNIAINYGSLTKMKIDNMKEQAENNPSNKKQNKPKVKQALIAVASGDGIVKMFTDAGATHVISGGQSMNPSVENIVEAIEKVNAENVIILPNNKNIILSAEQAASIVDCNVFVVKTKTIPQGITACISYNSEEDFEENCESMSEAIEEVVSCQVTHAVKDSNINGLTIKTGDILGIKEDTIVCNHPNYISVVLDLFSKSVDDDTSLVTVILGSELNDTIKTAIKNTLEEEYDDLDICFVEGMQEVYQVIIAFE